MTREPTTFEVDRIVDNLPDGTGLHEVQVTLASVQWRQILGDLADGIVKAREAGRPVLSALLRAGYSRGLRRMDAITRLATLLGQEQPSWALTPEEATALGSALLRASEEPSSCVLCGRFLDAPNHHH